MFLTQHPIKLRIPNPTKADAAATFCAPGTLSFFFFLYSPTFKLVKQIENYKNYHC